MPTSSVTVPFRNVIVCHMVPGSDEKVGSVFGHYDGITRPQDLGVIGRILLSFDDLYLHVIERKEDPEVSGQRRGLPAFEKIAEEIAPYVTPYSPKWTNPSMSVAKEFYHYVPERERPASTELTMIIQKLVPGSEPDIAAIFTDSDAGPMPAALGVTGRWLYSNDDCFIHLLEQDSELAQATRGDHRDQPKFAEMMRALSPYVSPYRPEGHRGPQDSVAKVFYRWQAQD